MATFNPEVRAAGYAHLGLEVPKHGTGAIVEGFTVTEHPVAVGGFGGSLDSNSIRSKVTPVRVVDIGVHVLATGEAARKIAGDETAEVVSYGRNAYNGEINVTTERTVDGQRTVERVKHPSWELREALAGNIQPFLEIPRAPFTTEPSVRFNKVKLAVTPSANGRVHRRELIAAR